MSKLKHIDEIYKDWCGESHIINSCHPVHDSAAACDFAEYYYKERTELTPNCASEKFNKRNFIIRIISLPFVFAIMFIAHNFFVLKRTYHFMMFGGEYINFEENERENIQEIFKLLKEIKNSPPKQFISKSFVYLHRCPLPTQKT